MSIAHKVDCEVCKNRNSIHCEDCINREDLLDHFDPEIKEITEEEKLEEYERQRDELCDESVDITLTPEFIDAFQKVLGFASRENPQFMPVWVGENGLVGTDCKALCELYCNIPDELKGKYIVKIEDDQVGLACTIRWPDVKSLFVRNYKYICNPVFEPSSTIHIEGRRCLSLVLAEENDFEISIDPSYYEAVKNVVGSIFKVGYEKQTSLVLFEGQFGRAVVARCIK